MTPSSRILSALLPLLLLGVSGGAAHAADVEIQAGLWQVTTVITIAMIDKATTSTRMECLRKNPFTPERRAAQHKSCQIDKTQVGDNEMAWKMVCETKIAKVVESGSFKLVGSGAHGEVSTTMTVGGQDMESGIVWDGKRLGDCDMERPKKPKKMSGKAAADATEAALGGE